MPRTDASLSIGTPRAEPSRGLDALLLRSVAEAVGHAVAQEVSRWEANVRTKTAEAKRARVQQGRQQTVEDDLEANLTAVTTTALTRAIRALSPGERLALIALVAGGETDPLATDMVGENEAGGLTTDQVAALLKVSRPYVGMLCDAGKLGAVTRTKGGYRRLSAAAVAAYLAEQAKGVSGATPREAGVRARLYEDADTYYADPGRGLTKTSSKAKSRAARSRGAVVK